MRAAIDGLVVSEYSPRIETGDRDRKDRTAEVSKSTAEDINDCSPLAVEGVKRIVIPANISPGQYDGIQ